jgi:hypothetical protein
MSWIEIIPDINHLFGGLINVQMSGRYFDAVKWYFPEPASITT